MIDTDKIRLDLVTPRDMRLELNKLAKETGESINSIVREAIRQYLKREVYKEK